MPELSVLGERALVAGLIRKLDPGGARRLGGDCAMLEQGNEYLLLTTDMITRTSHMPEGARPEDIGWYAAAVNLSDIAAMGGEPMGMLFAIGLPRETDTGWLGALISGMEECCNRYGAPILGGDTKESPEPTISGVAVGRVPKDRVLRRGGAKPGDILAMTGKLGRGIAWERDRQDAARLLRVEPRVKEGMMLARSGEATSCIDISDGLSTSLHLMSKAGGVGFEVEMQSIPMEQGLDQAEREAALHWGGDFELLFTAKTEESIRKMANVTIIGRVTESGIMLDGKSLPDMGYEHFRRGEP